jgi:hypothetical protein
VTLPAFTTQAPGVIEVAEIGYSDIRWSYDSDPTVQPRKHFGNGLSHNTKVAPMPAYAHDVAQVRELLEECHEQAPLCAPVTVSVLHLLDARNTNGWAQQQWEYYSCYSPAKCECDVIADGEKKRSRNWDGVIVLSGRTTEIHPAIARYVVAHEYGHIVEDALALIRHDDGKSADAGRAVLREWAKVRRIPDEAFDLPYGPTTHHLIPSEVFANDFRFMLGFETEWWPHHDVVPPLGSRGTARAQRWWEAALDDLARCFDEATAAVEAWEAS